MSDDAPKSETRTPPKNPSGTQARRAALKMLDAVLRRGETLDQTEASSTRGLPQFADRALARAIAGEVLRWLVDLDALIDSATRNRLSDDAKPRMVLRMMLAQLLRLETPPHAVVATGLPLLTGGQRRLAHGVFSTLSKQEVSLPDVPTLPEDAEFRWGEDAPERVLAIAAAIAAPPLLDLSLRDPAETEKWTKELEGKSLMPGHLRIARGAAIANLPGYGEGAWWVQDLAASLPARMLGAGEGKTVLDLCAAPGGKTLQLAAAGWTVTALDKSPKRLEILRQNLARSGLKAEVICADALTWDAPEQFDAILLDAPCTATGTCRRHPDVIHRIGPRQIDEMADLQEGLIERAAGWLKPGGRLVYAVCSLEREEGEDHAARVGFDPDPITMAELPDGLVPTPEGWLRTYPGMLAEEGSLDGFFIARWRNPA